MSKPVVFLIFSYYVFKLLTIWNLFLLGRQFDRERKYLKMLTGHTTLYIPAYKVLFKKYDLVALPAFMAIMYFLGTL